MDDKQQTQKLLVLDLGPTNSSGDMEVMHAWGTNGGTQWWKNDYWKQLPPPPPKVTDRIRKGSAIIQKLRQAQNIVTPVPVELAEMPVPSFNTVNPLEVPWGAVNALKSFIKNVQNAFRISPGYHVPVLDGTTSLSSLMFLSAKAFVKFVDNDENVVESASISLGGGSLWRVFRYLSNPKCLTLYDLADILGAIVEVDTTFEDTLLHIQDIQNLQNPVPL